MDIDILEDIGLTKAEIKVYTALLELGLTTVGDVIRKSGLQSSVVHNALNSLIKKGLVSYVLKGKIKRYQATDPKNILEFIENKKKRFEQILPELTLKQRLAKEIAETSAEVYEGSKAVFTGLLELIKDAKPGEELLFFAVSEEYPEAQEFFIKYDLVERQKKLLVKGIANFKLKPVFEKRRKKEGKDYVLHLRYVDFPIPSAITLFKDRVLIMEWGEKPVGVLITSKQITDTYRKLFYDIWNKGSL